jgi:hypothetical protein
VDRFVFSEKRKATSGTNYKYPLGCRQAIWVCSKARGGKIVDYLTDKQRSCGDKEPLGFGADLQFGTLDERICAPFFVKL